MKNSFGKWYKLEIILSIAYVIFMFIGTWVVDFYKLKQGF